MQGQWSSYWNSKTAPVWSTFPVGRVPNPRSASPLGRLSPGPRTHSDSFGVASRVAIVTNGALAVHGWFRHQHGPTLSHRKVSTRYTRSAQPPDEAARKRRSPMDQAESSGRVLRPVDYLSFGSGAVRPGGHDFEGRLPRSRGKALPHALQHFAKKIRESPICCCDTAMIKSSLKDRLKR